MFIQRANPVTNVMEWVYCADDDDNDEDDHTKHEIARSTYAGMLHDNERNFKYYEGIRKAINKAKSAGTATSVLDIGTGTGILAMMAAECGADSVTACEVFKPMAKVAEKVVEENALKSRVKVIQKRSTELTVGKDKDLKEKVNILVTEIFDSELIGEGVLPTLRHAHQNLLQSGCKVIPSSATVYIQFAESASLWKRHKLSHLMFQSGRPMMSLQSLKNCRGTAAVDELHVDSVDDMKILSRPVPAVRFSFDGCPENLIYEKRKNELSQSVRLTSSGVVHCIVMWWDLTLDEDGEIILSMQPKCSSQNPDKVLWRDHWMQALFFLPVELHVLKGDFLDVTTYFDDYSFWFDVGKDGKETSKLERPICTCKFHTVWSRGRFAMCNDGEFWNKYCSVLEKQESRKKALVLGDVSLLPLFAAEYYDQVVYIEFSQMSKDVISKLASCNKLLDKIEILNSRDIHEEELIATMEKSDVVLAEPFFSASLLPWHHLTFWYHYSKVSQSSCAAPVFIPGKGVVKIAAVQFEDLWKVRKPIERIGEFQLGSFDAVIKDALQPDDADEYGPLFEAEPYAVWEYENQIISDIVDCGCFDFSKVVSDEKMAVFEGSIDFNRDGVFHAIIAWVDFHLDEKISWTTGFDLHQNKWVSYSKQGVVFIENPFSVKCAMSVKYRVVFKHESCSMLFQLLQDR